MALLAASQPRGDDGQKGGLPAAQGLEVVRQVGVERHAVALAELVSPPVAYEHHRTVLDERGLAAARLMHWWVIGGAGGAAGGESVARELGALPRLRRG